MDFVTVLTAFNPADAQLARSRLEAAGFHPFVANENSALSIEGYAITVGGIRVQVPESEATDAKEFLEMLGAPSHFQELARGFESGQKKLGGNNQ